MPAKKNKVLFDEKDRDYYEPVPKKKTNTTITDITEPSSPPRTAPVMITRENINPPVKKAVAVPAEAESPYYKKTLWHGIKEVYQCNQCGVFRPAEDAMIVHVVIHAPRLEQNALLDQLMKEYKK